MREKRWKYTWRRTCSIRKSRQFHGKIWQDNGYKCNVNMNNLLYPICSLNSYIKFYTETSFYLSIVQTYPGNCFILYSHKMQASIITQICVIMLRKLVA